MDVVYHLLGPKANQLSESCLTISEIKASISWFDHYYKDKSKSSSAAST